MEEKIRLFPALDHIVKTSAFLVSNTSSLNVTQMGAVTKRPDKVCGLHFFNPASVMKLVEIVRTISTSFITDAGLKKCSPHTLSGRFVTAPIWVTFSEEVLETRNALVFTM